MGFEQLAALRDQLAAQAAQQKQQNRQGKEAGRQPSGKDASSEPRARPADKAAGTGRPSGKPANARQNAGKPGGNKRPARPARPEPTDPLVLAISRLQRQFPAAFPRKPAPKVPLKLGIHNDLYALSESLQLDQPQIKAAIQEWCQGSRYWACLIEDAARIDLSGATVGTVTVEEAKRARQLAGRQRWQARNAKKQAAQTATAAADGAAPADTDAAANTPADTPVQAADAPASDALPQQAATPVDSTSAAPDAAAPAWVAPAQDQANDQAAPLAADATEPAGQTDAPEGDTPPAA